jgi:hypothetical protein
VGDVGLVAEMQEEHTGIVIGQLCSENRFLHLDQTLCTNL